MAGRQRGIRTSWAKLIQKGISKGSGNTQSAYEIRSIYRQAIVSYRQPLISLWWAVTDKLSNKEGGKLK
ncbi:MAG TPA: hypothetical protein VMW45_03785 [Dehalococcoidia bacterium]|nr:hypothetical protein [Dehalococcoidia bacterium]